jgi:hypothetical protein
VPWQPSYSYIGIRQAGITPPIPAGAGIYRVTGQQDGATFGGYTIVVIGS